MSYIEIIVCCFSLLLFYFFFLKKKINDKKCYKDKIKIGVVLGSGGHTYEMLEIVKVLKKGSKNYKNKKCSFLFFYANNDRHSKKKAEMLLFNMEKEEELKSENVMNESENVKNESENMKNESENMKNESENVKNESESVKNESENVKNESENVKNESENDIKAKISEEKETFFISIPRCRNVGESIIIAIFKFLFIFIYCLFLVFPMDINVLVVNGPGVCLPIVFSFFFKKIFFSNKIKIVYIETVARIYSLSMTGKILYYFVDTFIVFSEILKNKYKRAKYYGYLF